MVPYLPILEIPEWLNGITGETMKEQPFPMHDILRDSLYYPASGLQGAPVQYLAGNILSFIYVDYGYTRSDHRKELECVGFTGYRRIGIRAIREEELTPRGYELQDLRPSDGNPERHRDWIKPPFCDWAVLDRCAGYADDHGPRRFSFLFLCADGVAAFQALYLQNKLAPKAIAIIQPGTGGGCNWTSFKDREKILGRTVLGNPSGQPTFLLNGGRGGQVKGRNDYPWWGWDKYGYPERGNEETKFLGNTGISVWSRTAR